MILTFVSPARPGAAVAATVLNGIASRSSLSFVALCSSALVGPFNAGQSGKWADTSLPTAINKPPLRLSTPSHEVTKTQRGTDSNALGEILTRRDAPIMITP